MISRVGRVQTSGACRHVWIAICAAILLSMSASTASAEIIFSEDFEGAFPGTNWLIDNFNASSPANWGTNNLRAVSGSWSCYCADPGNNAQDRYSDSMWTFMEREGISLADYDSAWVTFNVWMNTEPQFEDGGFIYGDRLIVFIYDENETWNEVYRRSGDHRNWETIRVPLHEYAGQTNLILSFDFVSDESVVPAPPSGVWIDDVVVTGIRAATLLDLDMTSLTVNPGTVTPDEKFTSCELDIFNRSGKLIADLPVIIEFFLSGNIAFGDDDDILIGDVDGSVDIEINAGTHLSLSGQGLDNMVRFWPSDLAEGEYYLFGRVVIDDPNFSDPVAGNDQFRRNTPIFFNIPLTAEYDGQMVETISTTVGRTVEVHVPPDAANVTGRIFKRHGGAVPFLSTPMSMSTPGTLSYALNSGDMTIRGLEYYFEISSDDEVVRVPDEEGFFTFRFDVPNIIVVTTRSREYQMIGLPFRPPSSAVTQIFDELPDFTEDTWRFGRYNDAIDAYTEYPALSSVVSGQGYWIITDAAVTIRSDGLSALPVNTTSPDRSTDVAVGSGWNQVANPFAFDVAVGEIDFGTNIEPALHEYQTNGSYRTVSLMEPYKGYWVHNSGNPAALVVPYRQAAVLSPKAVASAADGWGLRLRVQSDDRIDDATTLGVRADAHSGYDRYDISKPPSIGRYVSVASVVSGDDGSLHMLTTDMRPSGDDIEEFNLTVRGTTEAPVLLTAERLSDWPAGFAAVLVDPQTGVTTELLPDEPLPLPHAALATGNSYTLKVGLRELLVDESAGNGTVPYSFTLAQNYPNPFNAGTVITYTLTDDAQVSLDVFDVLGRHVVNLLDEVQGAGQHRAVWDGHTTDNLPAASGMYFYRITTGEASLTKKMLLVK